MGRRATYGWVQQRLEEAVSGGWCSLPGPTHGPLIASGTHVSPAPSSSHLLRLALEVFVRLVARVLQLPQDELLHLLLNQVAAIPSCGQLRGQNSKRGGWAVAVVFTGNVEGVVLWQL